MTDENPVSGERVQSAHDIGMRYGGDYCAELVDAVRARDKAMLRKYARHSEECAVWGPTLMCQFDGRESVERWQVDKRCSCGLRQLLEPTK